MSRLNFTPAQRASALLENANWLRSHRVDGVSLSLQAEALPASVRIYYCENCMFCHTDVEFFDVDHFVPDAVFRAAGRSSSSVIPENMAVLCKSRPGHKGERGCNQCKGGRLWVPAERGLAFTRQDLDLNCFPLRLRPFPFSVSG
jgi:hypothetical protein